MAWIVSIPVTTKLVHLGQVRSEWAGTIYPCVPGHEIVDHVTAIGGAVTQFKVGDTVGVGCMVDSCQHCSACGDGLEQYCEHGTIFTYNSPIADPPGHTLGGYSQRVVVNDKFVLKITHPEEQLAAVAPLLCAGITTYSPLRHWKAGPGRKVGIVGIGGLGHMGIKLAHAMGAHTVAQIEMIPIRKIDEAYDRMQKSDVKYRFVIDNASLSAGARGGFFRLVGRRYDPAASGWSQELKRVSCHHRDYWFVCRLAVCLAAAMGQYEQSVA